MLGRVPRQRVGMYVLRGNNKFNRHRTYYSKKYW